MDLLHPASSAGTFELFLLLISILAGIVGAILGLGGGVVIVPILTLGLGINIRYAIGASIVSVIATSSGAAAAYVKDRITNIRVAMLLEVATSLGALAGATLSPYVPEPFLFVIFSLTLFYSAWMMLKNRHESILSWDEADRWSKRLKLNSSYPDHALRKEISYGVTRVPLGCSLMLGAGLISGLLGIGSGVLKVPAMDSAMRLPIKVSTATSNFMIGVTAAVGAGAYYMRGDIIPLLAAPIALGVFVGVWIGTYLMRRLQSQLVRKIFIFFLLLIGLQMGFKAIGVYIR